MSYQLGKQRYAAVIPSALGKVGIQLHGETLVGIEILPRSTRAYSPTDPSARAIVRQLNEYFAGDREEFDVRLCLSGTPFQRRVWRALTDIHFGDTQTYGALAQRLSTSARAVGNACRRNPVPIIVPCHRVVAVNGIGGYAGATSGPVLERKHWLLAHESPQLAVAGNA